MHKLIDANKSRLVMRDSQTGRWVVNHLAVIEAAHEDRKNYAANNPEYLKRSLARYGWTFEPDVELVVKSEDVDAELRTKERELLKEAREIEQADWLTRVRYVQKLGWQGTQKAFKKQKTLSPALIRTFDYALRMTKHTGDFDKACQLLATMKRDTAYHYKNLSLSVQFANLRQNEGDAEQTEVKDWLNGLAERFKEGAQYTAEQRYELVGKAFQAHKQTAYSMLEKPQRYWQQDEQKRPFLTQRDADRLIKALFNVKSKKVQKDKERQHFYEIGATVDVAQLESTGRARLEDFAATHETVSMATERTDTSSTAYQLKLESVHETPKPYIKQSLVDTSTRSPLVADSADTRLADIPFTPSEVEAYQVRQ